MHLPSPFKEIVINVDLKLEETICFVFHVAFLPAVLQLVTTSGWMSSCTVLTHNSSFQLPPTICSCFIQSAVAVSRKRRCFGHMFRMPLMASMQQADAWVEQSELIAEPARFDRLQPMKTTHGVYPLGLANGTAELHLLFG